MLYRNGFLAGSKEVTLPPGASEVTFRQSIAESGQYVYRAVFETKEVAAARQRSRPSRI